jgi:hypothetical protein
MRRLLNLAAWRPLFVDPIPGQCPRPGCLLRLAMGHSAPASQVHRLAGRTIDMLRLMLAHHQPSRCQLSVQRCDSVTRPHSSVQESAQLCLIPSGNTTEDRALHILNVRGQVSV